MKRMICVRNQSMAEELADRGFRFMKQHQNGCEVFTFVESEELLEVLDDKRKYSKENWYADRRLRF